MTKKTIIAAVLTAPLMLAACGSTEGASAASATFEAGTPVLEETSGARIYPAEDKVVPAPAPTPPTIEELYVEVLDESGVTYTSESDVILAGRVACEFLDEGYLFSDLFIEMAASPQSERILPPVSNDDLPFVVGAAVPAFCPEHELLVRTDLGF